MERMDLAQLIALAAALGFASGLRLYAVLLAVGLVGHFHLAALPSGLEVLSNPLVIGAAAFLVLVELLADKIPMVDSLWDTVHTFIRIPAGAALAASVIGGDQAAWTVVAALLGGSLAATSHFAKAGTRAVANTSPEPFSNVILSTLEDFGVGALLWLAFTHPLIAAVVVLVLVVVAVWMVRTLVGLVSRGFRSLFGERRQAVG
ncbi:MAG: DUF4126 domain-containing protein [Candidatus Eisenbacteria bacterium]|nr:DUF4126 domain-containing protein [Candidatus Eisenbacteria bacterium]